MVTQLFKPSMMRGSILTTVFLSNQFCNISESVMPDVLLYSWKEISVGSPHATNFLHKWTRASFPWVHPAFYHFEFFSAKLPFNAVQWSYTFVFVYDLLFLSVIEFIEPWCTSQVKRPWKESPRLLNLHFSIVSKIT